MAKVNYLNNRDLLKEIHKSKTSYCSYIAPEFGAFDIILPSLTKINRNTIAQGKRNRAERLTRLAWEQGIKETPKAKMDEFRIDPKKIEKTEVVFRIMTYDHIPLATVHKKKPKTTGDYHTKVNFPPFQHFTLDSEDQPHCVGKSHWVGGMENGHFSKDHGKMTNELAKMFMKLTERYSSRGNWRGYTYNDEMRSQALLQLSQVGLQFDESKSDNPFAYFSSCLGNSFTRILNIEKRNQSIRDDILEMNGMNPSYTRQSEWGGGGGGGGYED